MSNTMIKNDDARPEMDAMLSEFFQAEMPQPWPSFQAPMVRLKEPRSFWSRTSGRLALAACIALLVGGYLSLGAFFPRAQAPTGLQPVTPDIGKGFDKLKKDLPKIPNDRQADPMPMGQIN